MSLQMAWNWIFIVTLGATEWFITAVGSSMSLQIAWCWGLGATEWFITVVGSILCTFKIIRNLQKFNACFVFQVENWTDILHRHIKCVVLKTQTYWTTPMPSHWIPFAFTYIHSYIHGFLVLAIPSESDCLLIFCLSHMGTIPVSKFSL